MGVQCTLYMLSGERLLTGDVGGGLWGDLASSQHFAVMHWSTFTLAAVQSWFPKNAYDWTVFMQSYCPSCQVASKLLKSD